MEKILEHWLNILYSDISAAEEFALTNRQVLETHVGKVMFNAYLGKGFAIKCKEHGGNDLDRGLKYFEQAMLDFQKYPPTESEKYTLAEYILIFIRIDSTKNKLRLDDSRYIHLFEFIHKHHLLDNNRNNYLIGMKWINKCSLIGVYPEFTLETVNQEFDTTLKPYMDSVGSDFGLRDAVYKLIFDIKRRLRLFAEAEPYRKVYS